MQPFSIFLPLAMATAQNEHTGPTKENMRCRSGLRTYQVHIHDVFQCKLYSACNVRENCFASELMDR